MCYQPSTTNGFSMNDYKELEVWQKSMDLAVKVYAITTNFPQSELYGLTSQIRRSAVSIPSNIAEGSARSGSKGFVQFLFVARGSAAELETQLLLAIRFGFLCDSPEILKQILSIRKMLNALIRSLKVEP
jgi:four helix bundle protein